MFDLFILQPHHTILAMLLTFALGVFLLYNIQRSCGSQGYQVYALLLCLVPLFWSLYVWYLYDDCSTAFQLCNPSDAVPLGVDGLGLSIMVLTTGLFPICVVLMRTYKGVMVFLLLELVLLVSLLVLDLLGFYIAFEASLILLFLLIARAPYGSVDAAYKIVLYTVGGSLFFLPVVFMLYSEFGTTNLLTLIEVGESYLSPNRQMLLGWGMLIVFCVKIPLMPVHLWLPEAHVAAPTSGSVLLAGVLLKLGGLGLLRFMIPILPSFSAWIAPFIITLCIGSFVYSTLSTIKQVDMKRIVAYSSISHMALITLAIMSMSEHSVFTSTYMMVAHGIVSPGLFLVVGFIYERYHTKFIAYISGLGSYMPLLSVVFFILTCANLSFPLSPNFIAEVLCLISIFAVHEIYALIFCASQVLGAVYAFWTFNRVVHGVGTSAIGDLTRLEAGVLVPLLISVIWLGITPMA